MKAFIFGQKQAEAGDDEEDDGLIKKTEPTGDLVVDLLQSKGQGQERDRRTFARRTRSKSKSKKSKKSRRGFS